jgi:hypothetical protein
VKEGGKLCGWRIGMDLVFEYALSTMSEGSLASTVCHELSHSMGMTIMPGRSKEPPGLDPAKNVDDDGTYYINGTPCIDGKRDRGAGPHCASGVSKANLADAKFNDKSGTCIMFDSGGAADTEKAFCDTCKTYLKGRRLTDLKTSWLGRSSDEY